MGSRLAWVAFAVAMAVLLGAFPTRCAFAADNDGIPIARLDRPFLFTYGSWQDKAKIEGGVAKIVGVTNQGGGGARIDGAPIDLSARKDACPTIQVKVGPANKGTVLRLMLRDDQERSGIWLFPLPTEPQPKPAVVYPVDGASLEKPNSVEDKGMVDLKGVAQWQLVGDYAGGLVYDLEVSAVELRAPDATILAAREKRRAAELAAAAAASQALAEARKNIQHTAQSPTISSIRPAAPDVLAITIEDGRFIRSRIEPYIAQPGDDIVRSGPNVLVVDNGKLKTEAKDRYLNRANIRVGTIVGGADGKLFLATAESREGDPLETRLVELPESYAITSSDDPAYATATAPASVSRKSKPVDKCLPNEEQILRHVVLLRLPSPLVEGRSYTIAFPGVNVAKEQATYRHEPKTTISDSVHASQVGYRADDPYKRAFVSLWLGTAGAYTFQGLETFELLDDKTGRSVHQGKVELAMAADGVERLRVEKNYSQTAVYRLDFSTFTTPGTYRVYVPGVGCSRPFPIGADTWRKPFETALHGLLVQRSGIELGPPLIEFKRPRNFHPGDGVKIYDSKFSLVECTQIDGQDWFATLVEGRMDITLPDAWGGYADAGDFDRHPSHLMASYLLLELAELFPDAVAKRKLNLPTDEAGNSLPDLLDEALWNVDFFRRIQREDGGVRSGVEQSDHPRPNEPSWMCSLATIAFAPDPDTSYLYAAVAAKAARTLERYDKPRAQMLAKSAVAAWDWAEANYDRFKNLKGKFGQPFSEEMNHSKNTAAAELLALAGDKKYDEAFGKTTQLNDPNAVLIDQQAAAFVYARLPNGRGDEALKAKAKAAIVRQADASLAFAEGNVFGLTTEIPSLPEIGPVGYFTVPGMISQAVPRAHFLTNDPKYLAGAVRATNFMVGANPDNRTSMSGVGQQSPEAPFHMDSRTSEKFPPRGIPVYGVSDPARNDAFNDWVHTWHVGKTMAPNSRGWPATEAYVDLFLWPMMNEFTIRQNCGPMAYWWGYLSLRGKSK